MPGRWIHISIAGLLAAETGWAQIWETGRQFDEHYLPQVTERLQKGHYRMVEVDALEAARRGAALGQWRILWLRALEAQGKWEVIGDQLPGLTASLREDLPFLAEAWRLYRALGKIEAAEEVLGWGNETAMQRPLEERSAAELVALGRIAAALGADPGQVLDQFYAAARKKDPKWIDTYLASGELALQHQDYGRAAEEFRAGLKQAPRDPELRFGLARSFWPSDREEALKHAARALEINKDHAGARLLQAEQALQAERYDEAERLLQLAASVDARHPMVWAFRSVIATLRDNDTALADKACEQALAVRSRHPEVAYVIGRSLSKRYRFAEGMERQRQALAWDPEHQGARLQLANDLMRLGREDEAWQIAEAVAEADPYNVLAYNYLQLRDQLRAYATHETDRFIIRMRPEEWPVYGERALEILNEAHEVLTRKYGVELKTKTSVEFFAEQQDFAIRTFGELGGAGYLGVCFGPVITMNSPGSTASGFSNWEATLWHEFCHVVTLTATNNRMPRWLSEGISVHEETRRRPVWGQKMTPAFRQRILEYDADLMSGALSSAFLEAGNGEDLMFAYYQSSLMVEFLWETYGQDAFHRLLRELARGEPLERALAAATEAPGELFSKYIAYARDQARAYGPGVDWTRPKDDPFLEGNGIDRAAVEAHPRNFLIRQGYTRQLLAGERWEDAARSARALIDLFPDYVGEGNGYEALARARRALGQTTGETAALRQWANRSASAPAAYLRLLELDKETENWSALRDNATRQMAVNPFIKSAHYCRACAAGALGHRDEAARSFATLLRLNPENPAEVHYRLARLFAADETERARRHVLDALVEAPRYREARELLVELVEAETEEEEKEADVP